MKKLKYIIIIVGLLLSGCAGKSFNDFRVSAGFVSAYDVAVSEFHQGQVVEARDRLRGISEDDSDYTKAQKFLKRDVEPARLKLLRYYARKGKKEEGLGYWAKAEEAYQTATELSIQPKALIRYKKNMNLKVRQLRLDSLYEIRRDEDLVWLAWNQSYTPPIGLFGDDKVFKSSEENVNEGFKRRIKKTWLLADEYKKADMPEMAWLYADSYLRLSPGDKKAQDLKNAMATALPKGFKLPKDTAFVAKKKIKKPDTQKTISSKDVQKLMQQERWLEAKKEAKLLRKQGDPKADNLLEDIDDKMAKLAERAYNDANLAFRSERIDEAVGFWQRAVDLMPNEATYLESLRRGKQIQERLAALQREENDEDKRQNIEE